jgi:hypothetical protein
MNDIEIELIKAMCIKAYIHGQHDKPRHLFQEWLETELVNLQYGNGG